MTRSGTRLLSILFVLLMICRILPAQVAAARLQGTVKDPSGAAVTDARVSIVNTHTNVPAKTTTSMEGFFVFLSLQPGSYALSVEAEGFRKTVFTDIELNVGTTVVQNVDLDIGEIDEVRIDVNVPKQRVQLTDAQIGHVVKPRDIEVLPLLGRVPMALGLLNTGIQTDPGDPSVSRVNGTRMGSTSTRLDGANVSDNASPRFLLSNFPINSDSIEEARTITSGGKAEYGRGAGGQIQLITRSGTNVWHGNMFEYHRNTALNANTFFGNASGLPRPVYIQNTFGGSIGGPIVKNRTFFFFNYQGRRNVQQVVRNRLVLTPEAKAGLFRWRPPGSQEVRTFDIVANDPRGIGIDSNVAKLLKLLPDPNNYDIGDGLNTAGFRFNNPSIAAVDDISDDQATLKVDHDAWSGHHLFIRWTRSNPSFIDVVSNGDARFPGQPHATQGGARWALSLGSEWSITPGLLNEIRVVFKPTFTYLFDRPARIEGPMLLSNSWTDPLNPDFSSKLNPSTFQASENLTIVQGKHILKGGIEVLSARDWRSSDSGIWPNVRFDTLYGNAPSILSGPYGAIISSADRRSFEKLYNDLLGRMSQVTQTFYSDMESFQPAGTPRISAYQFREFSGFFQDDWKLHPRLELNLGLRYEFFGIPFEINGNQGSVDQAALISSTSQIDDISIKPGGSLYANDKNNFAPRIGIAWTPTGSGRTVLRASWGIYYDRLLGSNTNNVAVNTPGFSLTASVYPNAAGGDLRVSDGIPLQLPPTAVESQIPATRSTDLFLFSPNLRTGYVQQYSLSFQQEIFDGTVIEAGYVGNRGTKLFMNLNLNQPRIYEDFLGAFVELQDFQSNGIPVSPSNTIVRIFGTPQNAIAMLGDLAVSQGDVGRAADYLDRLIYTQYAKIGVSDFYLRNFPQFNRVIVGTNEGRSYFDSFQLSIRRQEGPLRFTANYTFSKSIDNISVDRGFTSPIDNFNVRLNRARSDFDIPHSFNLSLIYALPIGKGRRFATGIQSWINSIIGGWDIGLLTLWQSGQPVTFLSGRSTGPTSGSSFVNYTGAHNIGQVMREGDGVYWLTKEEIGRFSFPAAGEVGTGGRNTFRGPRYFNVDMSIVKKFSIYKQNVISIRAEAYNLFNNVNFAPPNTNLSTPATFGKISNTLGNPRFLQLALRYDF